jgi:hypothetical protein
VISDGEHVETSVPLLQVVSDVHVQVWLPTLPRRQQVPAPVADGDEPPPG